MSNRLYLLGIFGSVIIGIAMTFGIYFYVAFIFFLVVLFITVLLVVAVSIFQKDQKWKIALQILSFGVIAALTTKGILGFLEGRHLQNRDKVISAIYEYRRSEGKFPGNLAELPKQISSVKCNYVPDSTFANFRLYSRDFYGVPHQFTSKDSVWGR